MAGRCPSRPSRVRWVMEPDDPMQRVRDRRRRELIDELIPKLRRLNPLWSDEEILDTAESMAELRLLDEEIG